MLELVLEDESFVRISLSKLLNANSVVFHFDL